MLDKIIRNINTDVKLTSDGKTKTYDRFGKKPALAAQQDKDSLVFSPAAAYLAELEWELHNLEYPDDEKVRLEFVISGYLFRFIIDFSTYYTTLFQPVYIARVINKKNISVIFSLAKRKLWFIDHYQDINFVGLDALFEQLSKFNEDEKPEDSIYIEETLINSEIKLNSELQYILAAVFTFLDKLGKFKIIKKFQFNNEAKELVKIEKVTIKNAR